MAKIILGIHGLKNKPKDSLLEKWWRRSIKEGLRRLGHPFHTFKFELVYWAHILYPEPLNPTITNVKDSLFIEFPYVRSKHSATKETDKLRKKVLDVIDKGLDKILLNEDMSLNFTSISDLIIRRYFRDLDIYYHTDCPGDENELCTVPERIRGQLLKKLTEHRGKEILLIGHSMGSIVAYDVLSGEGRDIQIDTLITAGSPLGLPVVRSKIISEQQKRLETSISTSTPSNVKNHWFNFSDLRDKVAIDYKLSDDFDENLNMVRVVDVNVHNDYEYKGKINPHSVYGYLRAPELSKVIYDFLSRGRPKTIICMTEKIFSTIDRIAGRYKSDGDEDEPG